MALIRRRPKSDRVQGSRSLPSWTAAAALSFVFIALAGGEALTQSGGCARCGASGVSPFGAFNLPALARPKRTIVASRWASRAMLRRVTAASSGYTICVRTCDGAFFPVSYFGPATRSDTLEQVCRLQCPNAEVALYSFPFGGTIDEAVSSTGEPYARLTNADKFAQSYDPACSCRAPGQSWVEALAAAEAKYGRHSRDILVTAEVSDRMSRPAQDQKVKPAAADPAETGAEAPVGLEPGLDVNGVDTSLSAEAKTISRATSGIRDEEAQRVPSYGLKQGRTVEEADPDGSIRRVRVLPSTL
jgi:hypothetical protein